MNWQINKRVLAGLATGLFLAVALVKTAQAWYPSYPSPYSNAYRAYPPYYPGANPYYWHGTPGPGFYRYREPRWYMRGRMNRYGDYRFDIRLRDMSMDDLYTAWMLYNGNGY